MNEKIRTTKVRIAVATVESVSLIPHFASIVDNPAKKAEPKANNNHILDDVHHSQ